MLLFIVVLALASAAQAGPASTGADASPASAGRPDGAAALAGVVTDATLSAAGQDFYRSFCAYWLDKPLNGNYAIAIREHLSARRGNQVVVEYAGRVVFRGTLPPGRGQVRPLGEQAAEMAYETVVNADVQRLLFSDDELAPDEL